MRYTISKLVVAAAALAPCAASIGCAGFDLSKPLAWREEEKEVFEEPRSIVAIWNENALHHADGRPATRGFGGRLLFYGQNPETPIKTEGKLIVYAYDETQSALRGEPVSATGKPTRKYEFAPDKFTQHYGESTVGHSYNFWIPWDNAGGERRIVTLAPMLVFAGGKTIHCEPKRCMLEGHMPQIRNVDVERYEYTPGIVDGGVRPASYDEPATGQAPRQQQRSIEPTTISLPPSLARRTIGMTPASAPPRTYQDAPSDPGAPAMYGQPNQVPLDNRGGYAAPAQPQQNLAGVNSLPANSTSRPTAYQPTPRGRFGLGQPPAPARQVAPPTTSQPSWSHYRSAQPPHPRTELGRRPPLNVPGTSIAGPSMPQ
jgi:hypothetical protein